MDNHTGLDLKSVNSFVPSYTKEFIEKILKALISNTPPFKRTAPQKKLHKLIKSANIEFNSEETTLETCFPPIEITNSNKKEIVRVLNLYLCHFEAVDIFLHEIFKDSNNEFYTTALYYLINFTHFITKQDRLTDRINEKLIINLLSNDYFIKYYVSLIDIRIFIEYISVQYVENTQNALFDNIPTPPPSLNHPLVNLNNALSKIECVEAINQERMSDINNAITACYEYYLDVLPDLTDIKLCLGIINSITIFMSKYRKFWAIQTYMESLDLIKSVLSPKEIALNLTRSISDIDPITECIDQVCLNTDLNELNRASFITLLTNMKQIFNGNDFYIDFFIKARAVLLAEKELTITHKIKVISFILYEVIPDINRNKQIVGHYEYLYLFWANISIQLTRIDNALLEPKIDDNKKKSLNQKADTLIHYITKTQNEIKEIIQYFTDIKKPLGLKLSIEMKLFCKNNISSFLIFALSTHFKVCCIYLKRNNLKLFEKSGLRFNLIYALFEKYKTIGKLTLSEEQINTLEQKSSLIKETLLKINRLNAGLRRYISTFEWTKLCLHEVIILKNAIYSKQVENEKINELYIIEDKVDAWDLPLFLNFQDMSEHNINNETLFLEKYYAAIKLLFQHYFTLNNYVLKDEYIVVKDMLQELINIVTRNKYISYCFDTNILINQVAIIKINFRIFQPPYTCTESTLCVNELFFLVDRLLKVQAELIEYKDLNERLEKTPNDFLPSVFKLVDGLLKLRSPIENSNELLQSSSKLLLNFVKYYTGSKAPMSCEVYLFNLFWKLQKLVSRHFLALNTIALPDEPKAIKLVAKEDKQNKTKSIQLHDQDRDHDFSFPESDLDNITNDFSKLEIRKANTKSIPNGAPAIQNQLPDKQDWNFGKETDSVEQEFLRALEHLFIDKEQKNNDKTVYFPNQTAHPLSAIVNTLHTHIVIPQEVSHILSILSSSENNWAYLVGGYIRDTLLQVEPEKIHDLDLVTNNPNLKEILSKNGYTVVQSKKRKTLFFVSKEHSHNERPIEIELTNTTLERDAHNRDITINAIYVDKNGTIVDPLNAVKDIYLDTIWVIDHAHTRFKEDPSRIFRHFRYSIQCNKKISIPTIKYIQELGGTIWELPFEKYKNMVLKTFYHRNFIDIIKKMAELDFLKNITNNPAHSTIIEDLEKIHKEFHRLHTDDFVFHKIISIFLFSNINQNPNQLAFKFYSGFIDYNKVTFHHRVQELTECLNALFIESKTPNFLPSLNKTLLEQSPVYNPDIQKMKDKPTVHNKPI